MKKLLLIGLFLTFTNAFAEDVATVLFTSNKATVIRNNAEIALVRGAKLAVGDAIKTGPKSAVNLKYNNGTLVNLGDNSNYRINSYSSKPNEVQVNADLTQGKMKFQTTGKSKEVLNTPIIALAILGTSAQIYVTSTGVYVDLANGVVLAGTSNLPSAQTSFVGVNGKVKEAQMPPEGNVNTPSDSEGSIGGFASSNPDDENANGQTSGSATGTTTTDEIGAVSALTTTQVLGDTTGGAAAAVPSIALNCVALPTGP